MRKGYKYIRAMKDKAIRDNLPTLEISVPGEKKPREIRELKYTEYKNMK